MADMLIHGDSEALILHILKNLTAELVGKNITFSTDLNGYTEGDRWVVVSQEGGSKTLWNVINKPRIDIEVRSESRTVSKDISEIAEASIFRAVGVSAWGCTLTEVKEETGIVRVPDKEEDSSHRYLFALRLTCYLHPDSLESAL